MLLTITMKFIFITNFTQAIRKVMAKLILKEQFEKFKPIIAAITIIITAC